MTRILPLVAGLAVGSLLLAASALALLPDEMVVSRTAVVRGDPQRVTHLVSHFPERLHWVAWTEVDPKADYTFAGTPGQPGATMAWVGDEIGTATLTLQRVEPGHTVVTELAYVAPFTMTSTDRFTFEPVDGGTRVTWTATAPLAYGPDRLFGLFADGMIGPDYERGLERLDLLLANES
jgi:hypothetical protein